MRKPRRSKRPISSATRPRRTASGLSRTRVVSVGIALPAVGGSGLGLVQRHRALLLRRRGRLAVRAQPPLRLERRAAALAGQLEPARAVRAGEEVGLDVAAAARAHALLAEPALHRADLELALAHVVQVLRRAQDACRRARRRTGRRAPSRSTRRRARVVDAALGVLVRPEHQRQPEHDEEEQDEQHDRVERARARRSPRRRPSGLSVDVAARGRLVGIRIDRSGGGVRVLYTIAFASA